MNIRRNISGQRFGKLTAIKPTRRDKKRNTFWLCKCDCGNMVERNLNDLTHEYTKSCGCIRKSKPTTHGKSANGVNYERWKAMKKRCLNPNDPYYSRYGGRGISVFPQWLHDFSAYDAYISSLPHHNESGYTVDRIDNDSNYELGNLRWATAKEQAHNRGGGKVNNDTITIKELRKLTGLSAQKFGDMYSIPLRTIQNWENGVNNPPIYVLELLERAVKEDFKHS